MTKRFASLALLAGWLTAGFVPQMAQAADPLQSITASPASEKLTLSPSSTYDGNLRITNTGQTAYTFSVSTSPFSVSGEDYTQSFVARPDLVDASKWFTFPRSSYSAKPNEVVPVTYRIKAPADVAAGGYYAVLFAESSANTGADGQSINARKRVGVLFYITVSGKTIQAGNVASYTVASIHTSAPLEANLRVANTGNVHFDATTDLTVSDIFGNTKAHLNSTNLIFPKSTRKINLQWKGAPAFGLFKVTGTVKYLDKTENLPTRYTLMLSSSAFVVMFLLIVALIAYAVLTHRKKRNVVRKKRR